MPALLSLLVSEENAVLFRAETRSRIAALESKEDAALEDAIKKAALLGSSHNLGSSSLTALLQLLTCNEQTGKSDPQLQEATRLLKANKARAKLKKCPAKSVDLEELEDVVKACEDAKIPEAEYDKIRTRSV